MNNESNDAAAETAACYFCRMHVDAKDNMCHGCNEIVCEDCTEPGCDPWGEHHPEDHQAEEDD